MSEWGMGKGHELCTKEKGRLCLWEVFVCTPLCLRPPLKIIMFPVHRPGDLISGEWAHFFHILKIFLFFLSITPIVSIQQEKIYLKKRRFCGLPTGHYYGHPVDRKQTFFKDGLTGVIPGDVECLVPIIFKQSRTPAK